MSERREKEAGKRDEEREAIVRFACLGWGERDAEAGHAGESERGKEIDARRAKRDERGAVADGVSGGSQQQTGATNIRMN